MSLLTSEASEKNIIEDGIEKPQRVATFKVYVNENGDLYIDSRTFKNICEVYLEFYNNNVSNFEKINGKLFCKVSRDTIKEIEQLNLVPKLQAIYFEMKKYVEFNYENINNLENTNSFIYENEIIELEGNRENNFKKL